MHNYDGDHELTLAEHTWEFCRMTLPAHQGNRPSGGWSWGTV